MLRVTCKPFMLSVIMLSVIMLSVIMPSVVVANESYSQDKEENEESMLFFLTSLIVSLMINYNLLLWLKHIIPNNFLLRLSTYLYAPQTYHKQGKSCT